MSKRLLGGFLVILLALSVTSSVSADSQKYKNLPVRDLVWNDQTAKATDVPVVVMDGRTMIPAYLFKQFGYSLSSVGDKVIVKNTQNERYIRSAGIAHSFESFLWEAQNYEEQLSDAVLERAANEEIPEETVSRLQDQLKALQQSYQLQAQNLSQTPAKFEDYFEAGRWAEGMMTAYREMTEAGAEFLKEGTPESLKTYRSKKQKALKELQGAQLAVTKLFNRSMTKIQ
ncbi:hypothetical protein [Cohnella sp. AR92]|uniref:hypothetical protein n=1 Tax=Cohnella sp. AR92 TaxID=648716 RepID=UPI000F8D597F|nr:hypothetical protein [Cohnella sp. AR92]RUS45711.1 hypothetical protein ELR57_17755 [Cohnella sp. AR92]